MKKVMAALRWCFRDWDDQFTIDIASNDDDFDVVILHESGKKYQFLAKIEGDKAQFEFCDDVWEEINQEMMFTYMWFQEAQKGSR